MNPTSPLRSNITLATARSRAKSAQSRRPILELLFETLLAFILLIVAGGFGYFFLNGDKVAGFASGTGVYDPFWFLVAVSVSLAVPITLRIRSVMTIASANPSLILLLVYILISMISAQDFLAAKNATELYIVTYVVAIFCAVVLTPRRALNLMFLIGFLAVAISAGVAMLRPDLAIYSGSAFPGQWRGIFGHKNGLGMIAGTFVPIAIIWGPHVVGRRASIMIAVMGIFVLFKSGSAAGVAIAIAGVTAWFFKIWLKRVPTLIKLFGAISVVMLALPMLDQIQEIGLSVLGRDATLSGRTYIWGLILSEISANNIWFGMGVGASNSEGQKKLMENALRFNLDPHSGYLTLLMELGSVGLCLFFAVVLTGLVQSAAVMRSNIERKIQSVFAILIVCWLVAMTVESGPVVGCNAIAMFGFISVACVAKSYGYRLKRNSS